MISNRNGQAFAEAVFIFPIIVLMIFSVLWFARILLTWQQLVSAARYGTDMIANTNLSEDDIKKDIENYLTHRMIEGRKLNIDQIKEIKIDINSYPKIDIDVKDLTKVFVNINLLIKGLLAPDSEISTVSITYSYNLPGFFHFIGLKEFNIKTKSCVLSGTGCKNDIHNRL